MQLVGFRVTNFRSIEDSGWIETNNVTALIGTNESGKTNILMPASQLRAGLYKASPDRVLMVGDYVSIPDAEIEDLFLKSLLQDL